MNRTRKIVIAGIGTAVMLAVIAGMLLVPRLQTSTPGALPPSTGGPGGGGSGNGTGPSNGTGGGTVPSAGCNATAADPEAGNGTTANGTDPVGNGDDSNPSNGTGTGGCNATSVDHDSKGDQEASQHSHHFLEELQGDLMVLAGLFVAVLGAAANGLVSQARQIAGMLLGYASSVILPVLHR